MHSNNIHKNGYDFQNLVKHYLPLAPFIRKSTKGKDSIDFANPAAVKCLNAAILAVDYRTPFWDIPEGYLCPAVPGRADYIHHIADLLAIASNKDTEVKDPKGVRGLDIGTGANLIYPILGAQIYDWRFVASDVNKPSIKSANAIVQANSSIKKRVKLRQQTQSNQIFHGVIQEDEYFDFTMCNPPFHRSEEEAIKGNSRKLKGLKHHQNKRKSNAASTKKQMVNTPKSPALNFGGKSNELWCDGGEVAFISKMIKESADFKQNVSWFTCLVSKSANLCDLEKTLNHTNPRIVKRIEMGQGNKLSRFIAWRY